MVVVHQLLSGMEVLREMERVDTTGSDEPVPMHKVGGWVGRKAVGGR